ncbi:MAG: hypothetical protein R3B13_19400 [Polyangiaceae bacterium]
MSGEVMERLRRPGKLTLIVLVYLTCAIVANALWWGRSFDDWMLELRRWDYGWELMLPWAARRGQWVGRDLSYPIGPLWQALAALPTLGAPFSGARAVAGLHLVFPLASVAVCAALVFGQPLSDRARALALLGMCIFALYDDVRTFRAIFPLAVIVSYAAEDPKARGDWRRHALLSLIVVASVLLSFDTGLLCLGSFGAMVVYEVWLLRGGRQALRRASHALVAIVAGQAALALALAALGGSYGHFLSSSFGIVRAYGTTMVLAPSGFDPAAAVAFVLCATVLAVLVARRRQQPVLGTWLIGTLPLAYRSVLRADAEHLYAGLVPMAAVLVLVAVRAAAKRRFLAVSAGLLTTLFALAWFGAHRERPLAWAPTRFVALYRAWNRQPEPYDGEFARLRRWVEAHRPEQGGCVGLPASAEALHALTNVPGATDLMLGWTEPLQRRMAERVRERLCAHAVREIVSFDEGSWGFGDILLAQHELYRPTELLGPDLVASELRTRPTPPRTRPLPADLLATESPVLPAQLDIPLGRRVPWEHALRLEYSLELDSVRLLLGAMPRITVQFFDGEVALAKPVSVPYASVGKGLTSVLPVVADVAEWRWVAGRAPKQQRTADRLRILIEPQRSTPSPLRFRVHALTELIPGDEPVRTQPSCERDAALLMPHRSMARWTAARTDGDLQLRPNAKGLPLAEVFAPVVPCVDACLRTRLRVEGDAPDRVELELHVVDGYDRPRVVRYEGKPKDTPLPVELALQPWAGRSVFVRFGAQAKGAALNLGVFEQPRIVACRTHEELALKLHRGDLETRGEIEVVGSGALMTPTQRGVPPAELMVPLLATRDSCVALTASREGAKDESARVALDVGVLLGEEIARLSRVELGRDGDPIELEDLPLAEFADKWVRLRLAAWTTEDKDPTRLRIDRLRLHRCGDGAPWFE